MDEPLAALSRRQRGLLTRGQALHLGMSAATMDNLLRRLEWHRLYPEVYSVRPLPRDPVQCAELRVRAIQLWAPEAVLLRWTAAWWTGWLARLPDHLEIAVPPRRQLARQPGVAVRRQLIDAADVVKRRGVLTTCASRTALDLAAGGSTDLLDAMLREGWFDAAALRAALDRGTHRRGWRAARDAVEQCATRPFSAAERLLHRVLIAAGVTGWVANQSILIGEQRVMPDLLFAEERLVIEIDGREHHSSRESFERDRARQNLLVAAGYRVLRFTWAQLTSDPDGVVRQIIRELNRGA